MTTTPDPRPPFRRDASERLHARIGAPVEELMALLAAGADPNYRPTDRDATSLLVHLPRLTLEGLRVFLDAGADARAVAPRDGGSALHALIVPIDEDYAPRVAALLAAGADPNATDGDGLPALSHATAWARPDVVALLLRHGADPNRPDRWGRGPLHVAARRPDVLRLLLAHGADPARAAASGETALHVAVDRAELDAVVALTAAGCPLDARRHRDGATALHAAVRQGALALVRALVAAGADVRAPDQAGVTPLALAQQLSDEPLLAALGGVGGLAERAAREAARAAAEAKRQALLDRLEAGEAFFRVVRPGFKYESDDDHDVLWRDGVWIARWWDDFHGREHLRELTREGAWAEMVARAAAPGDGLEVTLAKVEAALRPVAR
jgi:ankyrin repeat protein